MRPISSSSLFLSGLGDTGIDFVFGVAGGEGE